MDIDPYLRTYFWANMQYEYPGLTYDFTEILDNVVHHCRRFSVNHSLRSTWYINIYGQKKVLKVIRKFF